MADTPQHFFRVILASTLEDKKLRIPVKFVRKFGDELSVFATLTVPNGRVWRVGLSSEGGKIWFLDGWNDFVEYHSICAGYFLVFKYEKNSKFHVLIFDTTACEIQYPYNFKEREDQQNSIPHDEIENEDFRQISGFTNRNHKGAANLDNSRLNHECENEMQSKKRKWEELVQIKETNHVSESKPGQSERGKLCSSQRNLHHRKHLNKNAEILYAPSPLAQDRDLKVKKTILKTTAHCGEDTHPTQNEDNEYEKELLALLASKGIAFSENYRVSSAEEREKIFNIAKSLKPKYPSFMIFFRQRHICGGSVFLPAKFVAKYLTQSAKRIIIQVSDGREWAVQIHRRKNSCYTKKGWKAFMTEMKLKADDICVFELVRMEDLKLKVSVFSGLKDNITD